ncbi:MAG: efflux RND transporter periplasmic adaptor subunit [Acidobacteriota bacterium]
MKKYFLLILAVILTFCSPQKEAIKDAKGETAHVHQSEAVSDHEHEIIHLSAEKIQAWKIRVARTRKTPAIRITTLSGILSLNLNQTSYISPFVTGKVASLATDLGRKVVKGQVLLTLNSPEYAQAQADFLQARARLNLSRQEFERAQRLFEKQAIEEKEYLRRKAEHEKLATEYGTLESILHSYGLDHSQIEKLIQNCENLKEGEALCQITDPYIPLYSPLSGTVIFRQVVLGEHVNPEQTLLTVSDLSRLWVILDAYEKDLPYIQEKAEIIIRAALYPDKDFLGKIDTIGDMIDQKLRTVKIRADVDNSLGLLKPNMYIQAVIKDEDPNRLIITLPEEAVQSLNGEKIVFVEEASGEFSVCHVEVGEQVENERIIITGLGEGEKVVVEGAFSLKVELTKETFGHQHVHSP